MNSADLADAAEKLTGRRCHMSSSIRLIAGTACEGPAITLHLVRNDATPAHVLGMQVVQFLQSAPAGAVLVITLDDGADYAAFGAGLGLLGRSRSLAGVVIDGAIRDRAELRGVALPVFARGTVAGSAGGHYRLASTNEPIFCGGIEIRPGDLIVGDEDGVAVAPRGSEEDVRAIAEQLAADERVLLIRLGLSSP
jgi:4-hydroxy-4-methyl-2-oxoglutarate aldolase